MPTYISLHNWTQQGAESFSSTLDRAARLGDLIEQVGGRLKDVYWTMGPHDVVVVLEAPDDETASAAILRLTSAGSAHSVTLRAFDRTEMQAIIDKATD